MSAVDYKKSKYVAFHQKISFDFDGKTLYAFKGDTIASALFRNNIFLTGRSFKYHRPRGIYTCGIEEPNGLVQIISENSEPNVRATVKILHHDMKVESQNRWPSLQFDITSINNILSPLFTAGFYYKTFQGPGNFWKNIYEPIIRKTAGLGKPPKEFKSHSTHLHHNVDYVIVGGGLSGLLAARSFINSEKQILLIEMDDHLGGTLKDTYKISKVDGEENYNWIKNLEQEISNSPNIKVFKNTMVTTYNYKDHLIAVEDPFAGKPKDPSEPEYILHKIRADEIILANGCIERLISFENNDLPGVILASAFEKYACRFGIIPSQQPVIFTNNSSTISLLKLLIEEGIKPKAYVDTRDGNEIDKEISELLIKNNIPLFTKSVVAKALGKHKVNSVIVKDSHNVITNLETDMLCVSGGFNPDIHLFTQSKGVIDWSKENHTFEPKENYQSTHCIGATSGSFNFEETLKKLETTINNLGGKFITPSLEYTSNTNYTITPLWEVQHLKKSRWSKSFIDLQNDVTTKDLRQAILEGFDRIEHLKRFTTNSMGTDQGKISSIVALGIVSKHLSKPINEVGTTIYRPPYSPLSFSAIAGRNTYEFYDPERVTPIQEWHLKHGAVFEDVGQWKRPWYFQQDKKETLHQAVQRESKHIREHAGILDGSTLGKIEIKGKDALEFMNLIYTNSFNKMKPGTSRYALMLGEDGMVKDDGIICKISDQHFIATTTTGGAANVLAHMEEFSQTEWPNLHVFMNSITEEFCTFNISGPKTRDIMKLVFPEIDFSTEAFPFMSFKFFDYENTKIRIMRASFTGEMGYEIYIPSLHGLKLWEKIHHYGKDFSLIPYGTETMHLLRAEKGYIIVGQDTDGSVTPIDLGLNWMIGKTKKDFIGARSLLRSDTIRKDRKQLVGIVAKEKSNIIQEGQHIINESEINPPVDMLGHITSSYYSPTLGRYIALAVIKNGHNLIGKEAFVSTEDLKTIPVDIVSPIFIDPENKKLTA